MQPTPGFSDQLERCREEGQKLHFRIMCQNGVPKVPLWVREAGAQGVAYSDNADNWQPYYDDPVFLEKHENLIRALAERYDGHPEMDYFDIGSVGRWGEWHTSGTGMDMPDDSTRITIIDQYLKYWKKTPLVMLIGAEYGLTYAIANGTGWRADCLGDMGGFSYTWNHMEDLYQQALDAADANDAWKTAPVVFETCWTIQYWYDKNWDIDFILSEALRWHVTQLNNGSETIPEEWWPKIVEFEKKMGYRFVLNKLAHLESVPTGGRLALKMDWENVGVAPCYRRHPLAVRLKNTSSGESREFVTDEDISTWLPGEVTCNPVLTVPGDMPPGSYEIAIAMLDPHYGTPAIKFAVEGALEDGWYSWSTITIR